MQAIVKFLDLYIKIIGNQNQIDSITIIDIPTFEDYTNDSEVAKAKRQLIEYLNGQRKVFDLNLNFTCTNYALKVYQFLQESNYGQVLTYKDIADNLDLGKAYRAIGNINNKNQFVIVIPCHRVIRSDGSVGGYAYGEKYKKYLLNLEGDNNNG